MCSREELDVLGVGAGVGAYAGGAWCVEEVCVCMWGGWRGGGFGD